MHTKSTISRGFIAISLALSIVGVGFFTALTLGLFKKGDTGIVKGVAQTAEFKSETRFVILPASLLHDTGPKSLADRIKGVQNEKVVCSISDKQFTSFLALPGTSQGSIELDQRKVAFVALPNNSDKKSISSIFESENINTLKCVTAADGSLFFFDSTPSISAQRTGNHNA